MLPPDVRVREARERPQAFHATLDACEAEPGCREFKVYREKDQPRTFVLYEIYEDETAFQAHRESDHFKRYVLDDAVANGRRKGL